MKLLSEKNMAFVHLIEGRYRAFLRELAVLASHKESNLSCMLKKLEEVGIVGFM